MTGPPFDATTIDTPRLSLTPLEPDDADAMADVLGDTRLHEFIGGAPASRAELRERYAGMVAGPAGGNEAWCNWILRTAPEGQPVGTVQATSSRSAGGRWSADVAWVVGVEWQGRGFVSEAARALVGWLRDRGVEVVRANIHPDHAASAAVARAAGLHPTERTLDGETVWELR